MVYVRLPDACVLTVQPGRQRERRAEAVPRWPFEAGDLQGEPLPQSLFTVDLSDRMQRLPQQVPRVVGQHSPSLTRSDGFARRYKRPQGVALVEAHVGL